MHELGLAMEVISIVSSRAAGARVGRVVLEVGRLTCVMPDALRFSFELASEGTPLEGAALDIVETPGVARCRACAAEVALDRPYGMCPCGGADLEVLSGSELLVKKVEVS